MKYSRQAVLSAVVVGSLILAACSSSKGSSSNTTSAGSATTGGGSTATTASSGTSGANTASAPGITVDTIKIGLITALTGVTSSNEVSTPPAVQARFDAQNAAGGINGRKLQLVTIDDQSTVAGDLSAAQNLVQQKGVFAVIGYSSFLFGSAKYLNQQGVPVVGSAFDGPEWGQEPYSNMFSYNPPSSTPYDGHFYTYDYVGTFLKSIGVTKLGGFAYGISPSATNAIKGTMTAAATKGVADCYGNYSVPFGTVDFTADALALKSKGCDGAVTAFVDSSDLAFATSVKQSGSNAKILNYTGYDQATLATAATRAAYAGVYFSNQVLFDKSNPAIAQMYANFEKYVPGFKPDTLLDFGQLGGYLSGDLMVTMLKNAGANPTRSSFISTNRQYSGYTAGGILPSPTNFTNFGTVNMLPETACTFYVQLQGDQFVSVPPGNKSTCGNRIPYTGFGQ